MDELERLRARVAELERQESAHRSTEQALTEAARQWHVTFDAVSDAVCLLDPEGRIQRCNRAMADLVGKGFKEIVGSMCWELMRCASGPAARCPVLRTLGTGHRGELEMHLRGRWFRVAADPVRDEQGRLTGAVHILRDITEQKRVEDERRTIEARIQQAQKLESLNVMAGSIAHNFNNLLTAILGNLELATTDLLPGSQARTCLDRADMAARRAAELSSLMLTFVGRARVHARPMDMTRAVQDVTTMLGAAIPAKVELTLQLASVPTVFNGDPAQIHQVVMNLVTNAIEAIGDGQGTVAIRTGAEFCDRARLQLPLAADDLPEGEYVYLEVADTGCGMDSDTQTRAFDPFFTTKFTGRGLGLAAVLGIVRGHQGAICLDSEPGRGTTVKVLLPRSAEQCTQEDERGRSETLAPCAQGGSVLLVDDEQVVLNAAKAMLERLGYHVLAASSGAEALEVFQAHADAIRCVVLDLTMPGMDGLDTCRELRRIDADVCVVFCSGHPEEHMAPNFAGAEPAAYIQKPFSLATLAVRMGEALQRKPKGSD